MKQLKHLQDELNARSGQAVAALRQEITRIASSAALARAMGGSRQYLQYREAAERLFKEHAERSARYTYTLTEAIDGPPLEALSHHVRLCSQALVAAVQYHIPKNYPGDVPGMLQSLKDQLQYTAERLLANFAHGMIGEEKLTKQSAPSVTIDQSGSTGAQVAIGDGNNLTANVQYSRVAQSLKNIMTMTEFQGLHSGAQDEFRDRAEHLIEEAEKSSPEEGKIKRWASRLSEFAKSLPAPIAGAVAAALTKILVGGA